MCPRERLVIISKQTGLSFVLKRIGPLAAIVTLALYLLVLYSTVTSKPPEYLSVSIYSESFIETACQHLLLLVGIDILTYRRYYDTPPILVGHQDYFLAPLPGRSRHAARGVSTSQSLYFVFVLLSFIYYFICCTKSKYKKISC